MKHSDYITHINNKEDEVYLKTCHFPVNMRLFRTSMAYRAIILHQCTYIKMLCLEEKKGYKKPHGMSSANAGLSFNIIGITKNRNKDNEYCQIMINPIIVGTGNRKVKALSNCGSLTLDKPIEVERWETVIVTFWDEEGNQHTKCFNKEQGSLTIQHEIDHNKGVLITDY